MFFEKIYRTLELRSESKLNIDLITAIISVLPTKEITVLNLR